MAEAIDELMVKLGLDVDGQSFQQGAQAFNQVRSAALSFGASIGVGLGLNALTRDFANAKDELGKFARTFGTTPQFVTSLGYALEQMGGSTEDAFASIERMRNLINDVSLGRINEDSFIQGIDPTALLGVQDMAEAYGILSDQIQSLPLEKQRLAMQSLGFSPADLRVMQSGREGMSSMFEEAQRVTTEMTDNAEAFNGSLTKMTAALTDVTNQISNNMMPDLINAMDQVTSFLRENGVDVAKYADKGITGIGEDIGDSILGYVADALQERGMSAADADAIRKGGLKGYLENRSGGGVMLNDYNIDWWSAKYGAGADSGMLNDDNIDAWLSKNGSDKRTLAQKVADYEDEIGAPRGFLAAQLQVESGMNPNAASPAGAVGLAQIMPATERALEKRVGRDLDPRNVDDALLMQSMVMKENYQRFNNWDDAARAYNAGWNRDTWGNPETAAYVPRIRRQMQANANTTINVDARGSTDPAAVEAAARRGAKKAISTASERASQDLNSPLQ